MTPRGLRGGPKSLGDVVIPTAMLTRRELGAQWAASATEVAVTLVPLASLHHGKDKIFIFYLIYINKY